MCNTYDVSDEQDLSCPLEKREHGGRMLIAHHEYPVAALFEQFQHWGAGESEICESPKTQGSTRTLYGVFPLSLVVG